MTIENILRQMFGLTVQKPRRRRNPTVMPKHLTTKERREYEAARRMSEEFHGGDVGIIELRPEERKALPRFVMEAGRLVDFAYDPPPGSDRYKPNDPYVHQVGDGGLFAPESQQKPIVAVDPITKRPIFVRRHSPMKMDPEKGFLR